MTEDTTAPAVATALPAVDLIAATPAPVAEVAAAPAAAPVPEVPIAPVPPTVDELAAYLGDVETKLEQLKAHLDLAVGKVEADSGFGHQAHAFLKNAETLADEGIAWVRRHL